MLAGPETVEAMFERFAANAGGDKRGKQSASLVVFDREPYPHLDHRVDEHRDPARELRRARGPPRRHAHFRLRAETAERFK